MISKIKRQVLINAISIAGKFIKEVFEESLVKDDSANILQVLF